MDSIVKDLHIISKISIKNKLGSDRGGLFIDHIYWFSSFLRWLTSDSRRQSINDLNSLLIRLHEKKSDTGHLPRAVTDVIPSAALGLQNLMATYSDDASSVSELQIIHDKLLSFSANLPPTKKAT